MARKQADTYRVTASSILRRPSFSRGVEDRRAGRPPMFDLDDWEYERGRLWATLAPVSMPLFIGGRPNPIAVALLAAAMDRGMIP